MRLNRFLAQTGCCSRRKADLLIQEGRIQVNGKTVKELGFKVDPERDRITLDGKLLKPVKKKRYVKLYKPRGYLTALGKDKHGRKTLSDLFEELGIKERLFPAGRLDYDSEGLLILTNDGDTANLLMHPSKKIPKTYKVKVKGKVNLEAFKKMKKGKKLEDTFLKPDSLKILKKGKDSTWLEITIHSGQKRIIRRFMSAFGYPVQRLIRTSIGRIGLDDLKPKEWKEIQPSELKATIRLANKK
ncbi:MAG: rRNA pseudouridine synthase [Aquificae bacterium]|nr:rRNA pseudouridine synthase [Aquificota bacterium]